MADKERDLCPLVIDLSSGFTKVGFGGEDIPRISFPSLLAFQQEKREKNDINQNAQDEIKVLVGNDALTHEYEKNHYSSLSFPIRNGMVTNLDHLDHMFLHMFDHYKINVLASLEQQPSMLNYM